MQLIGWILYERRLFGKKTQIIEVTIPPVTEEYGKDEYVDEGMTYQDYIDMSVVGGTSGYEPLYKTIEPERKESREIETFEISNKLKIIYDNELPNVVKKLESVDNEKHV